MGFRRLAALCLVLLGAVLVAPCASADEVAAAGQGEPGQAASGASVAELEAKIKDLEGRLQTCSTRLAQIGALEAEAQALLDEITKLTSEQKYDEARTKLGEFQKKYGGTQVARRAQSIAQELAVLGKPMPQQLGIQKWFQGENELDLSGQKTTLIVFWEEWCPHCKREVPKLSQLYTENKEAGLQVLGLTRCSKSSTEEVVQTFITNNKVSYPIAKENGEMATYFGVAGIPAAAVVSKGKVVWRGHPASLTDEMLKKWM